MTLELFTGVSATLSLILITLSFIVIYQCIIRYWDLFTSKNVKFVRGLPIVGSHYKTFLGSLSLADSFQNNYNKFPKERFIGLYELGGKPSYLIRDPELVKQISIKDFEHFTNHPIEVHDGCDPLLNRSLFTMNDQKWRNMRSTLSPAFTGSKMKAMSSLLVEVANTFCKELKNELGGKTQIYDMKELFGRVANDVIASTAFGMNINSMKDRNNEFYKTGFKISQFGLKFFFYGIAPKIMNFFRIRVFDKRSTDFFRDLIKENMKYRQNNKIVRPDMINILLEVKEGMFNNGPAETDDNMGFATVTDDKVSNAKVHLFYPSKSSNQKYYPTKKISTPSNIFVPATTSKYPLNENYSGLGPDCDDKPIGFIAEWINAYVYLAQNQEKFYLYLIISVTAGILLCLILVIGRLLIQKRRLKKEPTSQTPNPTETTLPNGFSDDISEIDADIDLTTPLPLPSVSRNDQNYAAYAPSPSPYGNLGPSNLSHTSTTMLVPSNSIIGGQPPAIIGASNALMYPTVNTPTGTLMSPHYPPPVYLSGPLIPGHSTLRRAREYEHTPPRIMSKIDADQQYYYG